MAAAREKVADWKIGDDAECVYTEEMVDCLTVAAMDDLDEVREALRASEARAARYRKLAETHFLNKTSVERELKRAEKERDEAHKAWTVITNERLSDRWFQRAERVEAELAALRKAVEDEIELLAREDTEPGTRARLTAALQPVQERPNV